MKILDPRRKYNDAPDEFAEFLDSEQPVVSLEKLGGPENPFVKEGIFKECRTCQGACGQCFVTQLGIGADETDEICECCKSGTPPSDKSRFFSVDDERLCRFLSTKMSCPHVRQFMKTGAQFGRLRGHDIYFACHPNEGMYNALLCEPQAILIIGKNNPKLIPTELRPRTIHLSRLLYSYNGDLNIADDVIEAKIPLTPEEKRARTQATTSNEKKKKQSRPPIECYTPYYLKMIRDWILASQKNDHCKHPSWDYIADWLKENGPFDKKLSERTIRRHVEILLHSTTHRAGIDRRSAPFAIYWNGCLDRKFVLNFSDRDVNELIVSTFTIASKQGFKIRPMRGMDAAEYADRVKI